MASSAALWSSRDIKAEKVFPAIQQRPLFFPDVAKALWDRFEFVYTPKHGSWLNMAEIELNVLIKQCLDRRIDNLDQIQAEMGAWQKRRNNAKARIDWQFTSPDAHTKLKRLYPTLNV